MATTYYQPGVYIQEVDAPATSVTSVPTAIPAFIGYTYMAQAVAPNDLLFVPFQVNSLIEYIQYYGPGPGPTVFTVNLDSNYNFLDADVEIKYKMFDAVRMFFDNGGSTAYIVSVGLYTKNGFTPALLDFIPTTPTPTNPGPWIPLARLQQPTLIVIPDAMLFAPYRGNNNNFSWTNNWSQLYVTALQQCATVQSTFLIGDFYYNATLLNGSLENLYRYTDVNTTPAYDYNDEVTEFRENLGLNNLNYGAIYGPWIRIMPSTPITYAQLYNEQTQIYVGGALVSNLASLTTSTIVQEHAQDVENLLADALTINSTTTSMISQVSTSTNILNSVNTNHDILGPTSYPPSGSLVSLGMPSTITDLMGLYSYLKTLAAGGAITGVEGVEYIYYLAYSIANAIQGFVNTPGPPSATLEDTDLINYINATVVTPGIIASQLASLYDQLVQMENNIYANNPLALYICTSSTGAPNSTTMVSSTTIGTGSAYVLIKVNGNYVLAGTWTGSLPDAHTAAISVATYLQYLTNSGWVSNLPGFYFGTNTSNELQITGPLLPGAWNLEFYTTAANGITGYNDPGHTIPITVNTQTAYNSSVAQMTNGHFNNTLLTGTSGSGPWQGGTTWTAPNHVVFNETTALTPFTWDAASSSANLTLALQWLDPIMLQIIAEYNTLLPWAQNTEAGLEAILASSFPAFANIVNGVNSTPIPFPPSGAMAGVYANIDNSVGVWKAPANTSINGIVGPDWAFDSVNYDDLNVDLQAGKSINAIRTFTGRGTLVWGARTLAGNDIHWRYVPVRRFFIMVEQSIKLALNAYVFEPNSATTWTTVISEVTAYLYDQWRAGALQGTTPQQAFSVQCGLGSTMTQADILNGNMIVQIGMAVVRPAEFIILQFSQTIQPGNSN